MGASLPRCWALPPSVCCTPRAAAAAIAAALSRSRSRRLVAHALLGATRTAKQLWDYDGSAVKQLSLTDVQLLHRLSFGHRNQRSYLIVLYEPGSPACQAFEAEVERLASGLRRERAFVAGALDVSGRDAASFARHILGVDAVPAVLLYPEAARGFLRFLGPDLSAQGMLAAINKARARALPATATSPSAAEWQLVESATPLSMTSLRAAAASGDSEALVAALHQQMQPLRPTPLSVQQGAGFWAHGRAWLWGGMLAASGLFLAWDVWLADAWEDWCLARRQAARVRGRSFTAQENLDDLMTMLMANVRGAGFQQRAARAAQQQAEVAAASAEARQAEVEADASRAEAEALQRGAQPRRDVVIMEPQSGGGWAASDEQRAK